MTPKSPPAADTTADSTTSAADAPVLDHHAKDRPHRAVGSYSWPGHQDVPLCAEAFHKLRVQLLDTEQIYHHEPLKEPALCAGLPE